MNKIAIQLVAALFLLAAIASCDKMRAVVVHEKIQGYNVI